MAIFEDPPKEADSKEDKCNVLCGLGLWLRGTRLETTEKQSRKEGVDERLKFEKKDALMKKLNFPTSTNERRKYQPPRRNAG